jgi:hypothetical protein
MAHPEDTTRLYRAIRKYGWDSFDKLVLEVVSPMSETPARERWWIEKLQAANPTCGYNIKEKDGNYVEPTLEHRRKVSEGLRRFHASLSPEERKAKYFKGPPPNKGKPMSDEQREKLKAAHARRARKVEKIDKRTGQVIATYPSLLVAAQAHECDPHQIGKALWGERASYRGFRWHYAVS